MVMEEEVRRLWSLFPTGVALVSAVGADGRVYSMTANSVTSASLEPPLVLICVGHERTMHALIAQGSAFSVGFLTSEQGDAAAHFAVSTNQRGGEAPIAYRMSASGAPLPDGCLGSLECVLEASYQAGDHTIFLGRVLELNRGEGRPLVFYRGGFTRVDEP